MDNLSDKLDKEATVTIPLSLYNELIESSKKYHQNKDSYNKKICNNISTKSIDEVKSQKENEECIWVKDETYKGYYTTSCKMYYLPCIAKKERRCPYCKKVIKLNERK